MTNEAEFHGTLNVDPEYQDPPRHDADIPLLPRRGVLDDRAIAAAITKLEDDSRWRIEPADLPEVVAAIERERRLHQMFLERGNLSPDDRQVQINGMRYCEQKLIELGPVVRFHNLAKTDPSYPLGTPLPGLGPRFDAARWADSVELIETLTGETATRRGTHHYVRCPWHEDRTPSLVIYPPGRGWWCFVCGIGGSNLDFVMRHLKSANPVEALLFLESIVTTYPDSWGGEVRS